MPWLQREVLLSLGERSRSGTERRWKTEPQLNARGRFRRIRAWFGSLNDLRDRRKRLAVRRFMIVGRLPGFHKRNHVEGAGTR